jgi:DNA polymerase-3 subunit epsilon
MREIVLDTETTGLSYVNGDRVIEIGCIEVVDKKITRNSYHVYINPEIEVSEAATQVTGLTYGFLKQYGTFKEIFVEFLDFIRDDRLVIHNASFDVGFLNHELSLIGVEPISNTRVIDTLAMTREKYPGSAATLDALCRKFSIDTTERSKHGALVDARLLAEVYLHLSVELLQRDIFEALGKGGSQEASDVVTAHRVEQRNFDLPETEVLAHNKLIEKIKDPIWNKFIGLCG